MLTSLSWFTDIANTGRKAVVFRACNSISPSSRSQKLQCPLTGQPGAIPKVLNPPQLSCLLSRPSMDQNTRSSLLGDSSVDEAMVWPGRSLGRSRRSPGLLRLTPSNKDGKATHVKGTCTLPHIDLGLGITASAGRARNVYTNIYIHLSLSLSPSLSLSLSFSLYLPLPLRMNIVVQIYIYRYMYMCAHMYIYIYHYTYIHVYIYMVPPPKT